MRGRFANHLSDKELINRTEKEFKRFISDKLQGKHVGKSKGPFLKKNTQTADRNLKTVMLKSPRKVGTTVRCPKSPRGGVKDSKLRAARTGTSPRCWWEYNHTGIRENSKEAPWKLKTKILFSNLTLPKEVKSAYPYSMFLLSIATAVQKQKPSKCPSSDKGTQEAWRIGSMERCLGTQKEQNLSFVTKWVKLDRGHCI